MNDNFNKELIEVLPLDVSFVEEVFNLEKTIFGSADKNKIFNTINSKNLNYFVMKINDKVIGFFECFIMPPEAEIYDIAIDNEYRQKGLGYKLLLEFENFAKSSFCNTLLLEVNRINKPAIMLYKKAGYLEYGVRKNYYGDNDAILMKKLI